jgi:hypothetical protein
VSAALSPESTNFHCSSKARSKVDDQITLFLRSVTATCANRFCKHFSPGTLIPVYQYDPSYPLCILSKNTLCNSVVTHTLGVSVSKRLMKFNKQAYTRTDLTFKLSYLTIEAIFFRPNFRWLCLFFRVLDSISAGGIIEQRNMKWNLGTVIIKRYR